MASLARVRRSRRRRGHPGGQRISPDRCGDEAERRFPWAAGCRSETNTGFAGGVHLGAEAATGEVLVLLNDDAAAADGFVEAHLDTLAAHPDAAASAGRLVTWDGDAPRFRARRCDL